MEVGNRLREPNNDMGGCSPCFCTYDTVEISASRLPSLCTVGASSGCKTLLISGGDGYEDFSSSGQSEAVGREDSTNHLLLWQV